MGRGLRAIVWSGLILVFTVAAAQAAEGGGVARGSEFLLLVQIALLIAVGRSLGELMQGIGQPSVIGELIAGLLLGPSVFGALWPSAQATIFPHSPEQKAMIDGIAQFGILLLLLLAGMEIDLKLVRQVGRPAVTISIFGIAVPFACGFALGQIMPDSLLPHPEARLVASLFLGTALSISSVKIVAVVVREMNFMRRNVGQIIIATAVIDDTIGWIIIAVIFSIAQHGSVDLLSVGKAVLGTGLFLALSFTIGRRLVARSIRLANDHLVSSAAVVTVILLIMCAMAMITNLIGVTTVLGAFIAGVLIGESPILTKQIDERLRGLIAGLFTPVFFGLAGLGTDLTKLRSPDLLLFTAALVVIASVGKFAGALTGGRIGGLNRQESLALASGMNARGSTEVIIATIGLSMGVLNQNLFSMIVTMAILTTLAMPPMLRAALARLPARQEEQSRLDLEEFEDRGFVGNLERLLLAVDDSGNARLASQITGWLAGPRALPVTLLQLGGDGRPVEQLREDGARSEAVVKGAAKTSAANSGDAPGDVDIITRAKDTPLADAIRDEARKGFDLMVIGVDDVLGPDGRFGTSVEQLAEGFDGPVALARGGRPRQGMRTRREVRILVAVSGSGVSRRGAEVAIAIARASPARLHVIYVSTTRDRGVRHDATANPPGREIEILKETTDAAARYQLEATTAVSADTAPEQAILREIEAIDADLVVLGVDRLQGDGLDFGAVGAAVLAQSRAPVLLVSSETNRSAQRGTEAA